MSETYHIDVQVEDQVGEVDVQPIDDAVRLTLLHLSAEPGAEVTVVLSDDEALEDLNRRYRGIASPTDVLSFENQARGPYAVGATGFPMYLGDIVISVDRAVAQAAASDGSLAEELQVLAVHGTLHLMGYDHGDDVEKARMWQVQGEILALLGVSIALPE